MAAALQQGPEVKRGHLLTAFRTARPTIASIVAPAGFGKSTVARQLAEEAGCAAIVCDCDGVIQQSDLARRVLAALAEETPARASALAQLMLAIGDGARDATALAPTLAAWPAETVPSIFIFENAESLDGNRTALDLLVQLLASRPDSRTPVICSRVNLRLNFVRFASQRELMALRADDLRFSREELRSIFQGLRVDLKVIERAFALSEGWPIGAQILRSMVADDSREPTLEHMSDVRAEDLYEYLSSEILRLYPQQTIDALIACAALPEATAEDVGAALGVTDAEAMLDAIVADSPFLSKNAQYVYRVHPLMHATLRTRYSERIATLPASVANAWLERKAYVRAAEFFCSSGDRASAARALNEIEIMETSAFSSTYARTLTSLDASSFAGFPRLFASSMNYRQFLSPPRDLMAETEAVRSALSAEMPVAQRAYVDYFRIEFSNQLGDLDAARRVADALARDVRVPSPPQNSLHAHVLLYQGFNAAMRGRLDEGEALLDAAWPLIITLDQVIGSSCVSRAALIARVRGHRSEERRLLAEGLERCKRAGISSRVARAHAEAAFGAWFAGEEEEAERSIADLARSVEGDGVLGFAHFCDCARGLVDDPPRGLETAAWVAQAHLVACATNSDAATAAHHARTALAYADASSLPFLRVLSRIAVAEKAPPDAEPMLRDAKTIASAIDSADLAASLDGLSRGAAHAGMLEPFVAQLRRRKPARAVLSVEFATGRVRYRGREVELRPRERRLLLLVARSTEPVPIDEATRSLWPDKEPRAARNALKTTLHRLRRSLGDVQLVLTTARGLQLRERADLDLKTIERAVRLAAATGALADESRDRLRGAAAHLQLPRQPDLRSWDWYASLERQLVEWLRMLANRLASDALSSRDYSEALRFAGVAADIDAYDEQPAEIIVRALLGLGDHTAALRAFRDYRALLKNELDTVPPKDLDALVRASMPVMAEVASRA